MYIHSNFAQYYLSKEHFKSNTMTTERFITFLMSFNNTWYGLKIQESSNLIHVQQTRYLRFEFSGFEFFKLLHAVLKCTQYEIENENSSTCT